LEEAAAVAEYHGDWAIAQDIIALKDKDGARDVGRPPGQGGNQMPRMRAGYWR
jgi:hypothetical protein